MNIHINLKSSKQKLILIFTLILVFGVALIFTFNSINTNEYSINIHTVEIEGNSGKTSLTTYSYTSGNYTVILNGVSDANKDNLAQTILKQVISQDKQPTKYTNSEFVDADKYSWTCTGFDAVHCWLASSSNMLRISGWADDFDNPVIENKSDAIEDDLLAFFSDNFTDAGGKPVDALSFYFDGIYGNNDYSTSAKLIEEVDNLHPNIIGKTFEGYNSKLCSDVLAKDYEIENNYDNLCHIKDLQNYAIEMSIEKLDPNSGETFAGSAHSMTLTGVVIDNSKSGTEQYVALLLADSDNEECPNTIPDNLTLQEAYSQQ